MDASDFSPNASLPLSSKMESLQRAIGALGLASGHSLSQDFTQLAQRLSPQPAPSPSKTQLQATQLQAAQPPSDLPAYRIAVFGPFNHGKSTLLNAILGDKTLPMDLIPTTGAAILVRYGPTLKSRLTLTNGQIKTEAGIELLREFAVLDEQRHMREDVAAIEIECPHPLLQQGMELLDLPGTNDRESQDELVYQQLLTADLVIQLLDGRKLMTLGEREHLRDWLQERGIETVLFVVNFLNLLEPDDQKPVLNRMRFVAESFRSDLPTGISNLYRVDALPALRAKLKGDVALLQTSGLPTLVSALEQLAQQQERSQAFQKRLEYLSQQIQTELRQQIATLEAEQVAAAKSRDRERQTIQQKAFTIIRQGFDRDLDQLRDWLTLSTLLDRYETEAVEALRNFEFKTWEAIALRPDWERTRDSVTDWIKKANQFAEIQPPQPIHLTLQFPEEPWVETQTDPSSSAQSSSPSGNPRPSSSGRDTLLAGGIGWALGGPIGAAVVGGTNYVLNQLSSDNPPPTSRPSNPSNPSSTVQAEEARYRHSVQRYFERLSYAGKTVLQTYETQAKQTLQTAFSQTTQPEMSPSPSPATTHQITLLQGILTQLEQPSG